MLSPTFASISLNAEEAAHIRWVDVSSFFSAQSKPGEIPGRKATELKDYFYPMSAEPPEILSGGFFTLNINDNLRNLHGIGYVPVMLVRFAGRR